MDGCLEFRHVTGHKYRAQARKSQLFEEAIPSGIHSLPIYNGYMQVTKLSLTNFRSYERLELSLGLGLTTVVGDNAQGKSNLLEAIYLLAIGKSYRAPSERDLVSWDTVESGGYSIVSAILINDQATTEVRVGLYCSAGGASVSKRVRINGLAKRTSDLVGVMRAVLFSAEDIDLVFGSPSGRRRYLDVLLSQLSRGYVKALSRYQRILSHRNAVLKSMREGRSGENELSFWDQEICKEGAVVMKERWASMDELSDLIGAAFARLSGGSSLAAQYVSTVPRPEDGDHAASIEQALIKTREQERALSMTMVGPHRDDIRLLLGGVEIAHHASRGQARIAALAMRLAEAQLLTAGHGESPILLLDDVLSELDEPRRALVLAEAGTYMQSVVTSADPTVLPDEYLRSAIRLRVQDGKIEKEEVV